jgi:hypothetical protein
MHQSVNGLDLAANIELGCLVVKVSDGRMLLVATKDFLCFLGPEKLVSVCLSQKKGGLHILVWLVHILDCENGQKSVISEVS